MKTYYMVNIPDIGDKIPLMFRAQTKWRSQLQYIDSKKDENDSQKPEYFTYDT